MAIIFQGKGKIIKNRLSMLQIQSPHEQFDVIFPFVRVAITIESILEHQKSRLGHENFHK